MKFLFITLILLVSTIATFSRPTPLANKPSTPRKLILPTVDTKFDIRIRELENMIASRKEVLEFSES